MVDLFVTTDWLAEHLADPEVAILDASWYMPAAERDPRAEFLRSHIPGAMFFGIDDIADTRTSLPHMLLPPAEFAQRVGELGISESMTIIVYDEAGLFSAPRVWWEFLAMGARHVRILEGGGAKWRAEGRPLEAGEAAHPQRSFVSAYRPELVADFDAVRAASGDGSRLIVDARPAARFRGVAPEPRPGLKAGHIPGSLNVPVTDLSEDGRLKAPDALKVIFAAAGIDPASPIVTTCGSGITASTLALALLVAGAKNVAVYDGSWAEWGGRPDAQVEA